MRCHYEVLEVARDADETAVKVAYKKMALRWHPDKNLDQPEEAKEQFQLVQQAYEVLSDKQERAWYDSHREQILRSADNANSTKDSVHLFDVFPYFTSTCFSGYGDDEKGFYAVYRQVFHNITKEDLSEVDLEDKDDFLNIPAFGDSLSNYEDVVHPFYSYWMAYNTRTTYNWLDERIPKDIRDRRVFKLVEKENKKIRTKAKKERNEEVRSLVEFVRKRDRRVQANVKRLQEKAQENRKKQEQISRERRSEQRRSNMAEEQAEWTKFDNVKAQLEEIERLLAGSSDSAEDSDDDGIRDDDPFLCVACNKLFKTQKAFENHEKSKKHKENVQLLKDVLQKEEELQSTSNKEDNLSEIDDLSNTTDEEAIVTHSSKKSKKKSKSKKVLLTVDTDLQQHNSDCSVKSETDANQSKQSVKIKKKRRKDKKGSDNGEEANPTATDTKDGRPKQTGEMLNGTDDRSQSQSHVCVTCKNIFVSNNKLFAHLKKSGHAKPLQ